MGMEVGGPGGGQAPQKADQAQQAGGADDAQQAGGQEQQSPEAQGMGDASQGAPPQDDGNSAQEAGGGPGADSEFQG